MGMNAPIFRFSNLPLLPVVMPGRCPMELPINLPPSTTLKRGTLLGHVTGSASDVQTITVSADSGTITYSGTNPLTGLDFSTSALAYDAAAATIQAALVAVFGVGNVTVTGTGPYVATFGGALANSPVPLMTASTGATIAHTTKGRTAGTYGAYASGNSDGTETPVAVLKWDVATDAAGNITEGGQASGNEWGATKPSTPAYFAGYFRCEELVGLDANAVSKLGKLISGTTAAGILDIN